MWVQRLVLVGTALGIAVLMVRCANPVPPSGGPRDRTPPRITASDPAQGAVNVSGRTLRLAFNEYVNRSSLREALTITPFVPGELAFSWDAREVTITFPEPFRDSTTYIVELSTDFSDVQGVSLESPLTFAFATGAKINSGTLAGRVVDGYSGAPQAGVDVLAYAQTSAPAAMAAWPERPDYQTQTGEDGTFRFEYLRETTYYVVALRDNNRNRRPDPLEPMAVPPRVQLPADSTQPPVPVPWLLARVDTLAPTLQRARAESRARTAFVFNEPMQVHRATLDEWTLIDSIAQDTVAIRGVYQQAEAPATVWLHTARMQATPHVLRVPRGGLTDTLGTPIDRERLRFTASAAPDTVRGALQALLPEPTSTDTLGYGALPPRARPRARFDHPVDSTVVRRVVSVQDTAGAAVPYHLTTVDGTEHALHIQWPPGGRVRIVGNPRNRPDTLQVRVRRLPASALGALEGRVMVVDTTWTTSGDSTTAAAPRRADSLNTASDKRSLRGRRWVQMEPTRPQVPVRPRMQPVGSDSTFRFEQLPEGEFSFRAFWDVDGNKRWNPGRLAPYRPAEAAAWSAQPTASRPRWTNVISAPLRIVTLSSSALYDTVYVPQRTPPAHR